VADPDVRVLVKFEYQLRFKEKISDALFSWDMYAQIELGDYVLVTDGWRLKSELENEELFLYLGDIERNTGWQTSEFAAEGIPQSGTMIVKLYQGIGFVNQYPTASLEIQLKSFKVIIIDDDNTIDSDVSLTTIINENNNFIPEPIKVKVADIPDRINNKVMYTNGKFLSDGTPTKLWQVKGTSIQEPLIVALARMISNQYIRPTIMYDGLVEDAHLDIGSVISDPWDGIKYIVHQIMSSQVASVNMQVKLIELIESEELLAEDTQNITTEDGVNILTG